MPQYFSKNKKTATNGLTPLLLVVPERTNKYSRAAAIGAYRGLTSQWPMTSSWASHRVWSICLKCRKRRRSYWRAAGAMPTRRPLLSSYALSARTRPVTNLIVIPPPACVSAPPNFFLLFLSSSFGPPPAPPTTTSHHTFHPFSSLFLSSFPHLIKCVIFMRPKYQPSPVPRQDGSARCKITHGPMYN